jgi:hypothetical protein
LGTEVRRRAGARTRRVAFGVTTGALADGAPLAVGTLDGSADDAGNPSVRGSDGATVGNALGTAFGTGTGLWTVAETISTDAWFDAGTAIHTRKRTAVIALSNPKPATIPLRTSSFEFLEPALVIVGFSCESYCPTDTAERTTPPGVTIDGRPPPSCQGPVTDGTAPPSDGDAPPKAPLTPS